MSDIEETFERIASIYRRSPVAPVASNEDQLELYGLYKQATEGDINIKHPGFFAFADRAKYRAWQDNLGVPRHEAMKRYIALAKELGYEDPGDSPVPWISPETWRREESWTIPDYDEKFPCIDDPKPCVATDSDREKAPAIATSEKDAMPPRGTVEEHLARLESPPETRMLRLFSPVWPICCERLSALVGHQGVDEVFETVVGQAHFLEDDAGKKKKKSIIDEKAAYQTLPAGTALYHCTDCESVYLASYEV